jgi:GR25 family glycosyltransferase involved in LPS biosynthesis
MLNIGITYNPSDELFTSGSNQTSILLLELFQKLHCNVTLVDVKSSDNEWWNNFPKPSNITFTNLHQVKNLDLLVDIDGYINSSYRKSVSKKSVVFMRTFLQFSEMDGSVYPEQPYRPRDFDSVSEIWCWDILNPTETIPSIQTLFSCPIRCVPFIWSSLVADFYSQDKSNTLNQSNHWNVHIAEKNNNNTTSSIIPLVAIRELHNKKIINAKYKCHNMEKKIDNQFLKENVLNNIEISTLPIEFMKKQSFYEWFDSENTILFSHTRFLPIRICLLNAIWMGIPLIHNSPIIKDIHPELERLFYFGNEINGICSAFSSFTKNPNDFYNALSDIRNKITEKWSISNNLSKWSDIFRSFFNSTPNITFETKPTKPVGKELVVAFSEMWGGFNWNNNFFTDALRQECKINNLDISIKGVEYESINYNPDIIFGPFTNTTKKWKNTPSSIPRIYFSAENWGLPTEDGFALQLSPYRIENDKHIRLPTWMTFIDWFNDSLELTTLNTDDNPNRLPIKLAMNSHSKSFNDREDFCAFVVSNPISQFRNEAFKALDSYKRVNSGGQLYNNIGGNLELKYPGGGCGDIPKYDFFSKHKFSLSFENSQAAGYITEKVLHAKMAGCVPLYWGDKNTDTDFVSGSFINLSQLSSPEQIIKVVQKLEENPDMCAKIASTPILNEEKKQAAINIISRISKKILEIIGVKLENEKAMCIDKTFVINLDTRTDRWNNLMKAEPYLENNVTRIPAVNGKSLQLNNFIYKIFKDNKFFWKKSVIGCFLSHLTAWTKIINEPGEYFLVLEDDVRFNKNWITTWNKAAEHIPKDAELLYLGGVLPPNRDALPSCLEEVNQYWSQIKPNNFFSPNVALPIFHFCAYSYIISKTGAKKLLEFLSQNQTPINELDHFIGHPAIGLKKYILNPLITHCFQDEDTKYINSQFNDLQRTNDFDSDIWNNTESFTFEEIEKIKNPKNGITLYHIDNNKPFEIYERKWLEEVLDTSLDFKPLTNLSSTVPDDSWFIVQRPHLDTLINYFNLLKNNNINFKVLHLSDEFSKDSIDFYSYSNCKAVIRNYVRDDIPKLSHIVTIPLGFHYKGESSRRFDDRSIVWSFHGTNWFNRKVLLEPISSIVPNNCHFTDTWNDPKQTLENCYLGRLNNSKFCPILRGNNVETFRLYEALESGTIPIYVRIDGDDTFWNMISRKLDLVELESWEKAAEFIKILCSDINKAEEYRAVIITNWQIWKNEIKSSIQQLK